MASTQKLYPPIIAGTTPPFYISESGTYICIVPFALNRLVTASEVGGVKLRIRDADTDIELGRLNSISFELNPNYSYAKFDLTNLRGIVVGKYYKIQVAYVDINNANNIGYYSTVSIIKCTAYPTVSIIELNSHNVNTNCVNYTGQYLNINDTSEKCYQYKFTLYNSNNTILTTTDWLLHNTNTDDESWSSIDNYILNYDCGDGDRYELQYSILTQNGLEVNSPRYIITGGFAILPQLKADLVAKVNNDNGCVDLYLESISDNDSEIYAGAFLITRTALDTNYKTQVQIATFNLVGSLPQGPIYRDFTVEQGQTYRYALQQFNNHGIYSSKIYAYEKDNNDDLVYRYDSELNKTVVNKYITIAFEDMFLYDGQKQLKIRFNPKISSFKTMLQETKKNTLGSKYPFFFKNGVVEYKEFQIAGLISYLMDTDEFFISRQDDLQMPFNWEDTTNITDDNIYYERQFKLKVLDWLNDGNIKLFRSPAEGNYLVRLSNVSLTPEDTLSRMIHSFQCTADEIDKSDSETLSKYNLISIDTQVDSELRFSTIVFADYIENLIKKIAINAVNPTEQEINTALTMFLNTNFIEGYNCQYIHFEDCSPIMKFTVDNEHSIMVGATGTYERQFTLDEVINTLKIQTVHRGMPGQVTFGVWTADSTIFNDIIKVEQKDIIDFPEYLGTSVRFYGGRSYNVVNNYFDNINSIKEQARDLLYLNFELKTEVYNVESLTKFAQDNNFVYTLRNRINSAEAILEKIRLYESQLAQVYKITFNDESLISISPEKIGERNTNDLFVDGAIFFMRNERDKYYQYNSKMNILTAINYDKIYVPIVNNYNEYINLGPTQICIDDEIIDIVDTQIYTIALKNNDYVPNYLAWGPLVQPTILYQMLGVKYNIETTSQALVTPIGFNRNLMQAYNEYVEAKKNYLAYVLQLEESTDSIILNKVRNISASEYDECSYFVWNNETFQFDVLSRAERLSFSGNSIWVPSSYEDFKENNFPYSPVTRDYVKIKQQQYLDILQAVLDLNSTKAVF